MWLTVIIQNKSLSRSKDDIKIVSWTGRQRPSDNNHEHNDKNNSREKLFTVFSLSLIASKQHSHLKMSLAEDYWFSLCFASGFVLRLQLSRGRTPCPDSTWPWFTSSSNMLACLPDLIKGQDNSNNRRSRAVKRPCLFCEMEHLKRIFRRQMKIFSNFY